MSRAHCRSSGYESIGLEDSEQDSLDSCSQAPLGASLQPEDNQKLKPQQLVGDRSPLPILDYDASFISRLDSTWRFQEIKRLKKQQEHLKTELSSAKERINVDPRRWSYDLHTQGWKCMSCSHCQEFCQQASWLLIGYTRVNSQSEVISAS